MGLKINKENIYFITPFSKYGGNNPIDTFMEKDFTISVNVKINKKNIPSQMDAFIFARNGKHSGIFTYLNENNDMDVRFCHWFIDEEGNDVIKSLSYILPENLEDKFNNYIIICDDTNKIISFYLDKIKVGDIDYQNLKKVDYTGTFIWLGCGNMLNNDQYKGIGDFEFKFLFCLDKKLTLNEILEINKNYKVKYLNFQSENGLPVLNDKIQNKENFKLFCDFEYKNKYKIWNLSNGDNFFQFYIDNNIYY